MIVGFSLITSNKQAVSAPQNLPSFKILYASAEVWSSMHPLNVMIFALALQFMFSMMTDAGAVQLYLTSPIVPE